MQHVFRGIAIGGALIGGGALFTVWEPGPFLLAAFVTLLACLVPIVFAREDGGHGRVFEGVRAYVRRSWRVLRGNPQVAMFLAANTAWEGTFAGARTFVVLYVTVGLDEPLWTSTAVLGSRRRRVRDRGHRVGPDRRPLGARPRDLRLRDHLRRRAPVRRARAEWHAWYLAIDLLRRHRRRQP